MALQVYMIGQAVAELGAAADGLYYAGGVAASNGQRAVASLDFASLLNRYLAQVGGEQGCFEDGCLEAAAITPDLGPGEGKRSARVSSWDTMV